MKRRILRTLLPILCVLASFPVSGKSSLTPGNLRCEYIVNPLGLDIPQPRLSWNLSATERGAVQTAYEIIVSDNLKDIKAERGNMWSTGEIASSQMIQIEYSGKKLTSFTRYYWRVRSYDKSGNASKWSEPAWFETAMMNESDWKARWIFDGSLVPENESDFYEDDPAPLFKKEFDVNKKIASARLYITGAGYYESYINGRKVGDRVLDPGWTTYSKQMLYSVFDVTEMLDKGGNAIGIMVGNGWYNLLPMRMWCRPDLNLRLYLDSGRPSVKAQLRITYTDGSVEEIVTDGSWKTAPGPIVRNNVYLGELYDARLEQAGWAEAGVEFANATPAIETEGPAGKLMVQMQPPIRVIERISPISVNEIEPGVFIYDMGVNFAGTTRIRVKGPAGTRVSLRYGEDIYPDDKLNGMTSVAGQIKGCNAGEGAPHTAWQEDAYILRGDLAGEEWTPRFTFHGFRYIEVKGWPGTPALDDLEGLRLSSDVENNGSFSCSNEMFNTLNDNIRRTFRSNMFSVQSDCPAREKFSYGGDILCTSEAFIYNFNMANFYRKIITDHYNALRPSGGVTETAPFVGIADAGPGDNSGPLGFQLAYTFLVDRLYEMYGDMRIIEEHYPYLKKQADYLISCSDDHLYNSGLSDHESLDERPFGLTESLFYYKHIVLMSKYAEITGNDADKKYFSETAARIKDKVRDTYFDPSAGRFANGTQTAQVFGLGYGLVSGDDERRAIRSLEDAFDARDGHISTGIFGTKMIFDVMRTRDMNERMYSVANKRDFPGWGYMVEKGATSLWETWAYSDNVFSQNHPMFGSVDEWFYRSLLGINPASPGFGKIIIKPQPAGDLTYARGYYESISGTIGSDWKIDNGKFILKVSIPANTTATVMVPAKSPGTVTENGKSAASSPGVKQMEPVSGYAVFEVGSGEYGFVADL